MKTKDGLRIYGAWAGNPAGFKDDVKLCIESVHEPGRGGMIHQCQKKRGHGKDGLYCKTHDPERIKAKQDAHHNRYETEWAVKSARQALLDEARAYALSARQLEANGEEADNTHLIKAFNALEKAEADYKAAIVLTK